MPEKDPERPPPLPAAPASPEAAAPRETAFPCGECGAPLAWDPEADALACAFCGTCEPVEVADRAVLERPLAAAGAAARGLGLEVRVATCRECGARVAFEGRATSEGCVYCGSPRVLAQEANRNALRPESLVPLDVSRDAVAAAVRAWARGLWFRPGDLVRHATRFDAVGVYAPFWSFDCRVRSDWRAQAGYHYWDTVTRPTRVNGRTVMRTQRVRRTRWVPAHGSREDAYDDLLVNASQGLPDELVAKLGGFDTAALVPYRPEYLAGWRAEEYAVDLEQGWERGAERVRDTQRARCAADVPGDTHRGLHVESRLSDVRWKHVLLPVWSLAYRYRGEAYTVLVNGQTGRVVGRAPWSWPKILLATALALVALAAALLALGAFG